MKTCHTLNLLPVLALACLLTKISESSSFQPLLTGPDMAYLNTRVTFRCFAPSSSPPVTYELMRNGSFLIGTHVDHEGDQTAIFRTKVTAASDGSYQCKSAAGGSTGVSNSIKLSVVIPASNTRVTSEPFPPVVYEGSRIALSCDVNSGSHLSYTWFFNTKELKSSTSTLYVSGNKLVIERVTPECAGNYYCMAWSAVQDIRRFSTSTEIQVVVKGSPPANFSLLLDDKEVGSVPATESLAASFQVPMVPGLDMGEARCRVKTEMQELKSVPVTLEVVPVGGDVKVEVDYLYTAESKLSAASLSCQISRGTFPFISWLLNNSVLPSGSHVDSQIQLIPSQLAVTDQRQTLILTELRPEDSGYYRCRARDSYDDSGPWLESAAVLVQVTDRILNSMQQHEATPCSETTPKPIMTPLEVITIVFCCFFFVMLAVSSACVFKMFDHKPALTNIPPANSAPHLSEPESQSRGMFTDAFSADYEGQNQTMEMCDMTGSCTSFDIV
ncbi:Fc receptor-like protein 5 isoform 3-T3 [Odontesthes bonariensis]